jgi:prepilin-type N-terminal cleavage/methylation domain-containing protein
MTRRGFSLAELMVALVIAGIIGIALTRLIINQARFMAGQDGTMRARASARAGFNVISQELRMVTPGGLLAASPDSITARVTFAAGVTCSQPSGGVQAVLLLPYDSATFAGATLRGFAWRDAVGAWHFEEPATITGGAVTTDCTGLTSPIPATISPASAVTVSSAPAAGAFRVVRLAPNSVSTPVGVPVYLYQRVRYELAPSVEIPGRIALWRTVLETMVREELVAPFDTTFSAFAFLVGNRLSSQASPPAVLDSVRGIRLRLIGESEEQPEGRSTPSRFDLTTDIVFINRAN